MTDTPILDPAVAAAPKQYKVAGAQEIVLKGVTASFDGTGAAGSYVPAVQIIDPGGTVIGTYTLNETLAAGASADVSWFPGIGVGSNTAAAKSLVATRIYKNFNQVIPSGVDTKILLDKVDHDSNGWADLTNHVINIPADGWYLLGAGVGWSATTDGAKYSAEIESDAPAVIDYVADVSGGTLSIQQTFMSAKYLTGVASVQLFTNQLAGVNQTVIGSRQTFLSVAAVL